MKTNCLKAILKGNMGHLRICWCFLFRLVVVGLGFRYLTPFVSSLLH